jgi:hypothetical protein
VIATLPARTRAFLEHGAPEGTRNREAFEAAAQLRDAGVLEAEAIPLIQGGAACCGLPANEATAAVRSAYQHNPRKPITRQVAAPYSFTPQPKPRPVTLTADAGAKMLAKYAIAYGRSPTLADFEAEFYERSDPRPLEDWRQDWRLLFAMQYDEADHIGIKPTVAGEAQIKSRNDWLREKQIAGTGLFVCLNPLKPEAPRVRNEDVAVWRFLLLENDRCPLIEQAALLAAAPLPIVAIISSGNRSLHAWLCVDAADEAAWRATAAVVFDRFTPAGFDRACATPSRLGRLPGFTRRDADRGTGEQRLLYCTTRPATKGILPL